MTTEIPTSDGQPSPLPAPQAPAGEDVPSAAMREPDPPDLTGEPAPRASGAETPGAEPPAASLPVPQPGQPDADAPEDLNFADVLAEHERNEDPPSHLSPGQRVKVRIIAITQDTIFVSTGSKVDGIVDREEMEVDGALPYAEGDMLDLYVVNVSPQEVKLSKIVRGAGGLAALEDAKEAGLPVEGKVTAQVKGGYAVEIMKRRAFCPTSQMDLRPPDSPEAFVGKLFPFLITRLEKSGRNIVVSRRTLLEREQAEHRDALLASVAVGDVIEAVITRLVPFGAFAELAPGVEGLIHLSEISWTRVAQADEAVAPGDRVRAKILSIDTGTKGVRVSLSIKQATDDPWKDAVTRLVPGDTVTGKVMRTTSFGAFVEILPGVEGLVHISELSFERRVAKPEDVVVPGDTVTVKIKEMEPEKRRIALSLRDAAGDPWENVSDLFTLESEVTGTVERRAPFGLFITLAPGITGLLPNSALPAGSSRKAVDRLAPGEAILVRIKEIDGQSRRISLAPAGETAGHGPEEKDWKRHAVPSSTPKAPALGALGMALQAAMQKKKPR
jgi:small subunit ribosomal protein S1